MLIGHDHQIYIILFKYVYIHYTHNYIIYYTYVWANINILLTIIYIL